LARNQGKHEFAHILDEHIKEDILMESMLEKMLDHLVPSLLFGGLIFIPTFLYSNQRFTTT
jgi:hypothetical protein